MMESICYFDMLDNCVCFFSQGIMYHSFCGISEPVATGVYILPFFFDPIGMDAATLWYYRK